jgi:hypothetical protein
MLTDGVLARQGQWNTRVAQATRTRCARTGGNGEIRSKGELLSNVKVTSGCARAREGRSGNQPDDLLELSHRGSDLGVLSLGNTVDYLCSSTGMRPDGDLPGAARDFAVQDDVKQICCGAARCTRNQLDEHSTNSSAPL